MDPVNNVIAVGQFQRTAENNVKILFFNRTDNGDVAPIGEINVHGIIEGTKQGQYIDQMQMYPAKVMLWRPYPEATIHGSIQIHSSAFGAFTTGEQ